MKKYPKFSIIIPTYNSQFFIATTLKAINNQKYPKEFIEIIIVDNNSQDNTIMIAKKYGASVFKQKGQPPQVCQQRNLGADKAHGDYLFFMDHDMELTPYFLLNLAKKIVDNKNGIDAWYVLEKVMSNNSLFGSIRSFEKNMYSETPVGAVRIIKKNKFNQTDDKYDISLSSTNADWDMDLQLRLINCNFSTTPDYLIHHEENLSLSQYLFKKVKYINSAVVYKEKWFKKDTLMYNNYVKSKQFSYYYRVFGVFVEKGKWKKLIKNFHLYLGWLLVSMLMMFVYLINKFNNHEK